MRREFEQFEQMDLSQPNPDFALNQNLEGLKLNPKVARVLLPWVLVVGAATAGVGTGIGSSSNVDTESTPGSPRASLVTDVPTAHVLPVADLEQDQRLTENEDWFQNLQESLGPNYRIENNALYYRDPRTSRSKFVLLKFYDDTATFNIGPDGEGGRETVRWVSDKHFYVRSELDNLLVAVDSDRHVSTFDTLSGFWQEDRLGNRKIMDYLLGRDGLYHIIIYDPVTNTRVVSMWVIDAKSGNLVQLP